MPFLNKLPSWRDIWLWKKVKSHEVYYTLHTLHMLWNKFAREILKSIFVFIWATFIYSMDLKCEIKNQERFQGWKHSFMIYELHFWVQKKRKKTTFKALNAREKASNSLIPYYFNYIEHSKDFKPKFMKNFLSFNLFIIWHMESFEGFS